MDVKNSPTKISTHAPLAGRDLSLFPVSKGSQAFQPTRPLRGATLMEILPFQYCFDFNPRAPCGARQNVSPNQSIIEVFQPTRPLRGATGKQRCENRCSTLFQPTRPLRGATFQYCFGIFSVPISTHAPLAGRDSRGIVLKSRLEYFNPRAPCGARPIPILL